jgi:pyrroline-5-carboxylate reductase
MSKVMIVGAGAMGGAILRGCLSRGLWKKADVILKEHNEESGRRKAEQYGVSWSADGHEAQDAELVLIAVKPAVVPSVLKELKPFHPKRVLSIAAAVTIDALESGLDEGTEVIRVMPNTPASVGEGMAAIAPGHKASEEFIKEAESIFQALGREAVVSERALDELGALSGAGPGYAFVIIDALADAGVLIGLPRKLAIEAAAQTLLGAAKMVLETGRHPAELRDEVTSPGGTTIAGIHAMEEHGIRAALMDGVKACLARSDELGGK